jgi:hypothetical protein
MLFPSAPRYHVGEGKSQGHRQAELADTTKSGLAPDLPAAFPNRATWLRKQLKARAWNRNDLHRQRGPDPKTIDKILHGEKIREDAVTAGASRRADQCQS